MRQLVEQLKEVTGNAAGAFNQFAKAIIACEDRTNELAVGYGPFLVGMPIAEDL